MYLLSITIRCRHCVCAHTDSGSCLKMSVRLLSACPLSSSDRKAPPPLHIPLKGGGLEAMSPQSASEAKPQQQMILMSILHNRMHLI